MSWIYWEINKLGAFQIVRFFETPCILLQLLPPIISHLNICLQTSKPHKQLWLMFCNPLCRLYLVWMLTVLDDHLHDVSILLPSTPSTPTGKKFLSIQLAPVHPAILRRAQYSDSPHPFAANKSPVQPDPKRRSTGSFWQIFSPPSIHCFWQAHNYPTCTNLCTAFFTTWRFPTFPLYLLQPCLLAVVAPKILCVPWVVCGSLFMTF